MGRYYFDYAASTPVDPAVEKAMRPYWSKVFGNPGALHWFGQEASAAVFKARDTIAKELGCNYREIIFTGSATEANNLALRGVVKATSDKRQATSKNDSSLSAPRSSLNPKIIVSAIEHDSVLDTARELEKEGVEVVYLPVSKSGIVDLKKLKAALDERTILVSVMYANNEIGTVQPIAKISRIVRDFREATSDKRQVTSKNNSLLFTLRFPLFHCDVVQAFNYLNCNVNDLGVDLMTLSAQKIYGPKGVGLLYVRANSEERTATRVGERKKSLFASRFPLSAIVTGGGQEYGFRSGTENVPGIVGFGKAVELVTHSREKVNKKLRRLQEYFLAKMKKIAPKVQLNGDLRNRLPNNIHMYIPGVSGQDLIIKLDLAGFAVSPGAACSARTCSPSHVLKALGYSDERATNSIRITFGRQTIKSDIDKLIKTLYNILKN